MVILTRDGYAFTPMSMPLIAIKLKTTTNDLRMVVVKQYPFIFAEVSKVNIHSLCLPGGMK